MEQQSEGWETKFTCAVPSAQHGPPDKEREVLIYGIYTGQYDSSNTMHTGTHSRGSTGTEPGPVSRLKGGGVGPIGGSST